MSSTWTLDHLPCPDCGQYRVRGFTLHNERDEHMHTHYVCTFYPAGTRKACGWHGWFVPGWDKYEENDD